ncbi:MAG: hypothetical protein MUO77_15680, partial [Anaerolineales bacterium]|nr:hypothetical protein [Anaerolineales bacterium]
STIDIIGGRYVDARAALNASSAWSGLGLIAVVALYIRQRKANKTESAWRSAKIGIGLLAVSGLDALPVAVIMVVIRNIVSLIEQWNTLIGAWIGSNLWAPHHIAALIAGVSAMMLAQFARGKSNSRQFTIMIIAGLGFASAFGLSIWVTLVFAIFWSIWLVVLFLQKTEKRSIAPMVFAGIMALFFAAPFLLGLFQDTSGGTGQFPIVFEIRTLMLLESFVREWSPMARSLIMLAILPANYLFELGFFFIIGIYWFKIKSKETIRSNPFYQAEILLLAVVLLIGSCLRSTVITSNDLGWRSWLPGQFVLLIWGVDVIEVLLFNKNDAMVAFIKPGEIAKTRTFLRVLIAIGILTSTLDILSIRLAWPVQAGQTIGQRSYSARLTYDYLRDHIPANVITQNNPTDILERPSGLYGTHQMVISDRTAYGVPADVFQKVVNEIKVLFINRNVTNWQLIDKLCQQYSIDVLIIKDTDPIWSSLATLKKQRPALYENVHYDLFACGNYTRFQK